MAPRGLRQNIDMIQISLGLSAFSEEYRAMETGVRAGCALGRRGPCPDGWYRRDREGAGLGLGGSSEDLLL